LENFVKNVFKAFLNEPPQEKIRQAILEFYKIKIISLKYERGLEKEKIKELKELAKRKKLKTVEVYLPTNKLLIYLSLFIALIMDMCGMGLF
jgi:hypothetical protein